MAKPKTKPAKAKAVPAKAVPAAAVAAAVAPTIQLIPDIKAPNFRGARAAWYAALQANVGNTPAQFAAACLDNPPCLTKAGTVEKPQGWLTFFTTNNKGVPAVAKIA